MIRLSVESVSRVWQEDGWYWPLQTSVIESELEVRLLLSGIVSRVGTAGGYINGQPTPLAAPTTIHSDGRNTHNLARLVWNGRCLSCPLEAVDW